MSKYSNNSKTQIIDDKPPKVKRPCCKLFVKQNGQYYKFCGYCGFEFPWR